MKNETLPGVLSLSNNWQTTYWLWIHSALIKQKRFAFPLVPGLSKTPSRGILNKKTLLYIRAKIQSENAGDATLSEWTKGGIDKKQEKLAAVLSVYEKYDVRTYAASLRDKFVEDSLNALYSIGVPAGAKEVLSTLGKHLVYRSH